MDRKVRKMTKENVEYFIKEYPHRTIASIARELRVDHTTLNYWKKKLIARGIPMDKSPDYVENVGTNDIIKQVTDENPHLLSTELSTEKGSLSTQKGRKKPIN